MDFTKIQISILVITAVIVFWYTIETHKLRKEAVRQTERLHQANAFTTLTTIHERLTNRVSYEIRGYLHTCFARDLVKVTLKVLGDNYVTNEAGTNIVDVDKVKSLQKDEDKLHEFNKELKACKTTVRNVNALEAVEWTLLDFDVIALPIWMGIKPAKEVARAYKPVLERTAKEIIPFVAIHQQLRGNPKYKMHYLYLLRELNISLQGLEVDNDIYCKRNGE